MNIEIKNRFNGETIATGDNSKSVAQDNRADLREADLRGADLFEAKLRGANLHGANLRGANLHKADLREAKLREADLREADLYKADLREADLYWADLREANLHGANLCEANLDWGSHDLIAEILRQAAGSEIEKLKIAGLILVSRDKCWKQFLAINDPLQNWAIEILSQWEGCPSVEDQPDEVDA